MQKPGHHILVCGSFRAAGDAKGACARKNSLDLIQYITSEISDRDLDDVLVSSTGCLNICDHGPVLVIYPEGAWYGEVDEAKIDGILDGLESSTLPEGRLA